MAVCFEDISFTKCPAPLRWSLSMENTDSCHIYTIYIYINIYTEVEIMWLLNPLLTRIIFDPNMDK